MGSSVLDFYPDARSTDVEAPVTKINPLPTYSRASGFPVSWTASDSDSGGLESLRVETRVGQTGYWTPWTYSPPSPIYSGPIGTTVYFRSQGIDRAEHKEAWPPGDGDAWTTLFTYLVKGTILDNRGVPKPDISINLTPASLNNSKTGQSGVYEAYLGYLGQLTLAVQPTAGYVNPPATYRDVADITLDSYLLPQTDWIRNGGFEDLYQPLSGWTINGQLYVHYTHGNTGQLAALLGATYTGPALQAEDGSISQSIKVPANSHKPTLAFMYRLTSASTFSASGFDVKVSNVSAESTVFASSTPASWTHTWIDLQTWVSQTITVTFTMHQAAGEPAVELFLDDISAGEWLTPVITQVTPLQVDVGEAVSITIKGENYIPTPTVSLGTTMLPGAKWIDASSLQVTVPATIPFGLYELRVANPGGQVGLAPKMVRVGSWIYLPISLKK